MVNLWIICSALLYLRDLKPVYSSNPKGKESKPKDGLSKSSDNIFRINSQRIARSVNGDLTLGAMLPIHKSSEGLCSEIYVDGILLVEAFVFALREVKNRKMLPEGITLGYEIRDTCNSVNVAQRHTLDIMHEQMQGKRERNNGYTNDSSAFTLPDSSRENKQSSNSVIAVVGAGNSEISLAVNRVLSAFNIPQIGFASTSRYLSEKRRFPSFFRTVPPDKYQVKGLVALFRKFSWTYVEILVSDGDYGRPLAESFRTFAKHEGICITYEHRVPFKVTREKAKSIVRKLNLKTNVDIVVILVPEPDSKIILGAMLEVGVTNKTLIASDSWTKAINDLELSNVVSGTLGFAHHYTQVKEFEDYFIGLKPNENPWNPWFNETWEHVFDCALPKRHQNNSKNGFVQSKKPKKQVCNLKEQHFKRKHFTRFHYVSNVINAVFAVVNGIERFFQEGNVTSSKPSFTVSSLTSLKLLETLKKMTFKKYDGDNITFDENGDVTGKYNLVNIRPNLTFTNVGMWNGEYLKLDDSERIWWNTDERSPPKGVCSLPCSAGWYQVSSKEDPKCCWTCQRCHAGTISNRSGASKCFPCAKDYTTNINRTSCVFIPLNYLNWRSFWTVSIVILALISISVLFFIATLFVRYVNTPVVKSSNRELSLLLGIGLFFTFLVPFVFAGKPTKFKCIISQVMFCVGCALALSAMLFKTLRILFLFESMNRRSWLLKNKYQIAMTIALTFAELTYCLLWVAVNPPGVKTVAIRPTKRYLVCEFDAYWYGGSHILLIVLSVVCTALAIRGRKLPKKFNEVRHIWVSMFTFNIIWVVFMCAQYGASLEYDVKINCFAMIISSLMILVLLFGPKVFVLLFRAHLNNKEEFEAAVRRYSFGVPNVFGTYSDSAASLRRGSAVTFQTTNDQFLSVGSDEFKRKRSQSFDAMASRLYHGQNANRLSKRCSKETQTNFFTDVVNTSNLAKPLESTQIIVEVTEEDYPNDIITKRDTRINVVTNDSNNSLSFDCQKNTTNCPVSASSLQGLNQLLDVNLDMNNMDNSDPECSEELNNLLDDLGVLDENISNGSTKSFATSIESFPRDVKPVLFSANPNSDRKECCQHCQNDENILDFGFKTPFQGTAHPRRTRNDLIEIDFNNEDDNLLKRDNRNGHDRETVL